MHYSQKVVGLILLVLLSCTYYNAVECIGEAFNYREALTKSLIYFEGQRSGKLPAHQRLQWRGDSGLRDGQGDSVDLVGGYYDAGDNVKFNFPMAYTVTMLAWGVVEYEANFIATNELGNVHQAIKWGTDYLLKCHVQPHVLYAGVGDGDSDHACWERPEDMDTPRTPFKIDEAHPGSDLAAETAAAFAAASIVFRKFNPKYSLTLIQHAVQLFDFAEGYKGKYSDSVPSAAKFYSSSDVEDELLWAAAWLHRATKEGKYKEVLANSANQGGTRTMFSWDDKYVGAQLLAAKYVLSGVENRQGNWAGYIQHIEEFVCNCIQKGDNNVLLTPGGLTWFSEWGNLQYTTSSSLIMTVYADYLTQTHNSLNCPHETNISPNQIIYFARSQVDYMLGKNPKGMSYMVGYGSKFPEKVHHRGASIVSVKVHKERIGCKEGYDVWYGSDQPNPNVIQGAIVGGPGRNDEYGDDRTDYKEGEPATATAAPFVGVLARLSA